MDQCFEQAAKWTTKAAEQGLVKAQYNLGCHYYKGQGVAQSFEQAARWFAKAAAQGNNEARRSLAGCMQLLRQERQMAQHL